MKKLFVSAAMLAMILPLAGCYTDYGPPNYGEGAYGSAYYPYSYSNGAYVSVGGGFGYHHRYWDEGHDNYYWR
jgi:hypothetical protein